ncbi:MAG TPA: isoprenylcysteine carboxylmethyltransferase family protein [Roseiflexaceae bacterium]|nr:isoprenylcysteine carboxylmethyltransferase family protein [Roseiflexaceae bacterium]
MVALKTLLFTILVPGTVTVLIPGWLVDWDGLALAEGIGALRWIGLAPLLVGAWFYLRCAWDFVVAGQGTPAPIDAPKHLVVRGLYRLVRNPMYVGVLLCIGGEALLFGSALLLIYAALLFLCFHMFITTYEEPTLQRLFGRSYEQYCAAVPRWLPRMGRMVGE